MKTIDLGQVRIMLRGEYNPEYTYHLLDLVSYQGSSYLVKKTVTGITPVDGEYYQIMAKRGDMGYPGHGTPSGGTKGQMLVKASNDDYDFTWADQMSRFVLEDIAVTTPPDKTSYQAGETFDTTGMVVKGTYTFGLSQFLTGYEIIPSGPLTADITEVTIRYSEGGVLKEVTQSVTVTRIPATLSFLPDTLYLNEMKLTDSTEIKYNGDGVLSIQNNKEGLVSASLEGNILSVTSLDDSQEDAIITVSAPETNMYTSVSAMVTVKNYALAPIFGAAWDGTGDPNWSRTDDAELFEDPVAAVNNGTGSSPFDGLLPWAGMVKMEDPVLGTVVKIPKYWYRRTRVGDSMTIQISSGPQEGFLVSPAHADRGDGEGERDVVYVARYHCTSDYTSKTQSLPKTGMARATARDAIHALGDEYWQYDFAMYWTVVMLYLVEYASWNSQTSIGNGCSINSEPFMLGATDNMQYHTGTNAVSREIYGSVQYRNIEGLWDNVFDWCDGIYFQGATIYCIKNPADFSDDTGGTEVGQRPTVNGYVKTWTDPQVEGFEYALYPATIGGESNAYGCDYCQYDQGEDGTTLRVGGYYAKSIWHGLFCFFASYNANHGHASIGARGMKLPNQRVA